MKGDKKPIARGRHRRRSQAPRALRAALRDILRAPRRHWRLHGHARWVPAHSPVIDLKTARASTGARHRDEITELVIEFGGTISSEHGDGRARKPLPQSMYGATHEGFRLQACLRSREPAEPRQHRRLTRYHENLRNGASTDWAEDAARLHRARWLRGRGGDVQRRGRVSQEPGRTMCPSYRSRATRALTRAAPTRCGRSVGRAATLEFRAAAIRVMDLCPSARAARRSARQRDWRR